MTDSTPVPPAVKIGELRRLREAEGLSLRGAAEQIGVHHATLARYEEGTHEPKASELIAMATAYKVRTTTVLAAVVAVRSEASKH